MVTVFKVWLISTIVITMLYEFTGWIRYTWNKKFFVRHLISILKDFYNYGFNVAIAIICFLVLWYLFGGISDYEKQMLDECVSPDMCW